MPRIPQFSQPGFSPEQPPSASGVVSGIREAGVRASQQTLGLISEKAHAASKRIQTADYLRRKSDLDLQLAQEVDQMQQERGAAVSPADIQSHVRQRYDSLRSEFDQSGMRLAAQAAEMDGLNEAARRSQQALDFKISRHMDNQRTATERVAENLSTQVRTGSIDLDQAILQASADVAALTDGLSGDHPIVKMADKIPAQLEVNDHALAIDSDELRPLEKPASIAAELVQAQAHLEGLKTGELYDFVDPAQRTVMVNQTEARIRSLLSAQKSASKMQTIQLTSELKDIQSAIVTGKDFDVSTLEDVEKWAPYRAQGQTEELEYRKTVLIAAQQPSFVELVSGDAANVPAALEQIRSFLQDDPTAKDFRVRELVMKEAESLVEQRRHELEADAATYVQTHSRLVRHKAQQLADAQLGGLLEEQQVAQREYNQAVIAEQDRMGALSVQLEPGPVVSTIGRMFSDPNVQSGEKVAVLQTLSARHGDMWPLVANQLQRSAKVPQGFGAVVELIDIDPDAASMVATAVTQFKTSKDAAGKDVMEAVERRVTSELDDFRASTLEGVSPQGARVYNDTYHAIVALALRNRFSTGETDQAVEDAYRTVIGDHYSFVSTGQVKIPVPVRYSAVDMEAALDQALGDVVTNEQDLVFMDDIGISDPVVAYDEYLDRLQTGAHWMPTQKGTHVQLVDFEGKLVRRADGSKITVSFDALEFEARQKIGVRPKISSKDRYQRLLTNSQGD